jgi:hypothetical protein
VYTELLSLSKFLRQYFPTSHHITLRFPFPKALSTQWACTSTQHTDHISRIVHFLSGLAHITLPQDPTKDLWIVGGKGGLLFAVDTQGLGHLTTYPSDRETVAIAVPFQDGAVPEYEVVKDGACEGLQTWV